MKNTNKVKYIYFKDYSFGNNAFKEDEMDKICDLLNKINYITKKFCDILQNKIEKLVINFNFLSYELFINTKPYW